MAITSFIQKNKKFSKVLGLAFVSALVVCSILFVSADDSANFQDVSVTWVGDNAINCHKPLSGQPDSALQNGVLNWTASVNNMGPGSIYIEKAAFHDPKAGCTATTHTLNQSIFAMSGKTSYAEGETGQVVFTYDTSRFNCGRVQVDAAYRNANGSGAGAVFMGEMIDYGVDCPVTPVTPTVGCPTLVGPVTGVRIGHANTDVYFSWNAATNADRYILDISEDSTFSWFWNNGTGAGGGIAGTTATFTSATNTHYSAGRAAPVNPVDGKTYYWRVYAYNSNYIGVAPGCHSAIRNFSVETPTVAPNPTPTPTPNPTPTPPPTGGGGSSPSLRVEKTVRNISVSSSGKFEEQVEARLNETVEFRIEVENRMSSTVRNVEFEDELPKELSYVSGTLKVDGNSNNSSITNLDLGSITRRDSKVVTFHARVNSSSNKTVTNTAEADGSNTSRDTDTAKVKIIAVQGGNVNLDLSKSAYNDTQGKNAVSVNARPGDVITYTLRVKNDGNSSAANFVFEDNISDLLQVANIEYTGGGRISADGKSIVWDGMTIPSNATVEKKFSVRLKSQIPTGTDCVMTNFYGNEVRVNVSCGFAAPRSGPGTTLSIGLATLSVAGFALYQAMAKKPKAV